MMVVEQRGMETERAVELRCTGGQHPSLCLAVLCSAWSPFWRLSLSVCATDTRAYVAVCPLDRVDVARIMAEFKRISKTLLYTQEIRFVDDLFHRYVLCLARKSGV